MFSSMKMQVLGIKKKNTTIYQDMRNKVKARYESEYKMVKHEE